MPDSTAQPFFPLGNVDAQFANQTQILGPPVTCPVFVIAAGRIQGAEGRSNTANLIFLSLLMLAASLAKPLMEL